MLMGSAMTLVTPHAAAFPEADASFERA